MRSPIHAGALVVLAVLLTSGASSAHDARASVCRGTQLALNVGQEPSAATGQNPITLRLTNRSRVACVLDGYPDVWFSDRRGRLPLIVKHGGGQGGDQQVTLRRPQPVLLSPGRTAYVIANKYRCDFGTLRVARAMRLALAGGARAVGVVTLRRLSGQKVSHCKGGATLNIVSVSPFVRSIGAGIRH